MPVRSLYKTNKSPILSTLTFNDAAFWGSDVFVGVIFALYITQNIQGGTAIQVGLVFGLYRLVRAISAIPIGQYLDRHKGHLDEYWTLFSAGAITGITYLSLFFATEMWQIYVGMAFIAFGHALDISSWRILFYSNIPSQSRGEVIGVYETVMQLVYGLSIVVAGFVGEIFGFEWTLLFAGIITFIASSLLLTVKRNLSEV